MFELLDYPFDAQKLLRKKKAIKRELLNKENLIKKRFAIMGGTTTNEVKEQLELFLLKSNIQAEFYECEFGQYYEAIIFEEEGLYNFNPDFVYLHISLENLKSLYDFKKTSEEKAEEEFNKLKSIWKKLNQDFQCEVIQDNFELPQFKPLGNFDSSSSSSISRTITLLNEMINKHSMKASFLYVCDRHYLSSKMGLAHWKDYSLWLSARYSLSYKAISSLCYSLSKIIESILGLSKKCLVLDLDNTLWGGVIGDDGLDGILLGRESAIGEAYLDFHLFIKQLKDRGVVLAICSKNDFENAKNGFDHPDSILQFADFTVFKANWDLKTKNIYEIAQEINIGLESIVFIDDNPVERDIVRKEFKGLVCVPEIGDDVTLYRDILDASQLFNIKSLSMEDANRNEFYRNDKKREDAISNFDNYNKYLESLEMTAEISQFSKNYLTRITQLTNKTNQFNLTTKRMSEQEIESLLKHSSNISLYARLNDKFGENGLVSLIQGNIEGDRIIIDLWVMSCRVFNRTLENTLLYEFLREAQSRNLKTVIGKYIPTQKNKIVSNLYEEMGFSMVDQNNGASTFELNLEGYSIPNNPNISLNKKI
jgi:FkbH-like protein